ncbi:hypothetical protein V5799_021615 [Amblyomma americanum]|uniref:Secreted protein n=1 Tax=Amblyomma americanum TaxID=6943 RepID=A0AAQ4FPQ4_AMBAM
MRFLFAKAVVVAKAFFLFNECKVFAETRIDNDENYEKCEDIYEAFNLSKIYSFYAFNLPRRYSAGRTCTYISVENLCQDGMNYSTIYLFIIPGK